MCVFAGYVPLGNFLIFPVMHESEKSVTIGRFLVTVKFAIFPIIFSPIDIGYQDRYRRLILPRGETDCNITPFIGVLNPLPKVCLELHFEELTLNDKRGCSLACYIPISIISLHLRS